MNDPFGRAVLDYLSQQHDPDITVESDLTEDETIPVAYLFRSEEDMPEKERFALSLASGRILDVGAGSGTHALLLQAKGYDVTALDFSANNCKAMLQRGIKQVVPEDFYLFKDPAGFDTLLFMMNGLGIAGTLNNLEVFLQKAYELLKPGGKLIGESADILYMFENEDGSYSIDLNAHYYGEMQYRMHYKNESTDWFPWLYVSMELLIEIAGKNGFTLGAYFEGEEGDYVVELVKRV